jgi:hypothetical protein
MALVKTIKCPDTEKTAVVEAEMEAQALYLAVFDEASVHVNHCSLWPERCGCSQSCRRLMAEGPYFNSYDL